MCLIALAWRAHPRYRLILASNRDEYHARPTSPLAAWPDAPEIVGGRDALHGGGWLALRGRRLAAVTNVRAPAQADGLSRGALVSDFVRGSADARTALRAIAADAMRYRPFNLLLHDGDALAFATNRAAAPRGERAPAAATRLLAPGIHGISNGEIDTRWPKTDALMARLDAWRASSASLNSDAGAPVGDAGGPDTPNLDALFDALADTTPAPDARLPSTGVGLELERVLSPAFIAHAAYGTRASTVVLIADDHATIVERRFGPDAHALGQTRMRIDARPAAR